MAVLHLPGDVVFALDALFMAYDFIIKLKPFFPKLAQIKRIESQSANEA